MIGRTSLLTIAIAALILSVVGPSNLRADIVNGDFERGNTGFTSGYTYVGAPFQPLTDPGGMWAEGTYTVDTNPKDYHDLWSVLGDHTTGSGQMLIANGSPTSGLRFGKERMASALSAGTYTFSAWVASVYPANPAELDFKVDGLSIGTIISVQPTRFMDAIQRNFHYRSGKSGFRFC